MQYDLDGDGAYTVPADLRTKVGGIARFYNGFWAAVIVGPLSRFGDTAANAGILAICDGVLPVGFATMLASAGAAVWRIATQPVQNVKRPQSPAIADRLG